MRRCIWKKKIFCRKSGHDNQCCYDKKGNLIETTNYNLGGFTHRFHYKGGSKDNVPYLSNIHSDIVPFVYCCEYYKHFQRNNAFCTEFLTIRPPSQCNGYIPPRIGICTCTLFWMFCCLDFHGWTPIIFNSKCLTKFTISSRHDNS